MKVAMCSITARKDCLLRTINSLVNQSVPCDIHLFLSEEPYLLDGGFTNKEAWRELTSLPVTIHWVPNWGPYRKTVSFMQLFPDEPFLAIDDDEEFHPDMMKFIEDTYKGGVLAFRATRYSDTPYNEWEAVPRPQRGVPLFHKGNGGVVYDSKLFQDPSFLNETACLELAPTNDDVWLNLWRMYHGIPVHVVPVDHDPMPQETRLWFYNHTKNDEIIENVKGYMDSLVK
jgi:hypothetical protein